MRGLFAICLVLAFNAVANAQVAVQQPVVSNIGVTTTVSVPDRGTVLLGGVSRSASSRRQSGFWPFATRPYGREVSHSNITATVRIHDLRAMDEYLLAIESGATPAVVPAITARGELAGRRMRERRKVGEPIVANRETPRTSIADRAFERGLRAEREGRPGVARLHFEMAARHGSRDAAERLTAALASRDRDER